MTKQRPASHSKVLCLLVSLFFTNQFASASFHKAGTLLKQADEALEDGAVRQAIEFYAHGIRQLPKRWSKLVDGNEDSSFPTTRDMKIALSLHTNYGTALIAHSDGNGSDEVLDAFKRAVVVYRDWDNSAREQDKDDVTVKEVAAKAYYFLGLTYQELADLKNNEEEQDDYLERATKGFDAATELDLDNWASTASQSYFFVGMLYQEKAAASTEKESREKYLQLALKAYQAAIEMDSKNWSSFASMGVVLADVGTDENGNNNSLQMFEEGIRYYQKGIDILESLRVDLKTPTAGPTVSDPPENVDELIAELQYSIGLSLIPFLVDPETAEEDHSNKMCKLPSTTEEKKCLNLAANQFRTALQSNPKHKAAQRALASLEADAKSKKMAEIQDLLTEYESVRKTFEIVKKAYQEKGSKGKRTSERDGKHNSEEKDEL